MWQTEKVIVDRNEGHLYIARSQYDSPEVDQEILIDRKQALAVTGGKHPEPGDFMTVVIAAAEEYDLYADAVGYAGEL